MQVSTENTLFMQKAIYYLSKLIAARGVIEVTDRKINFQVCSLDCSFGINDLSIDICSVKEVTLGGGEFHTKVVVITEERKYEFVLSKGKEFYDLLNKLCKDPIGEADYTGGELRECDCGCKISNNYNYCPWCGKKNFIG